MLHYISMSYKNLGKRVQKKEGMIILKQIDALKREFVFENDEPITARRIFALAQVEETWGNKVLHGKQPGRPTLNKIRNVVCHLIHSQKIKQLNF